MQPQPYSSLLDRTYKVAEVAVTFGIHLLVESFTLLTGTGHILHIPKSSIPKTQPVNLEPCRSSQGRWAAGDADQPTELPGDLLNASSALVK